MCYCNPDIRTPYCDKCHYKMWTDIQELKKQKEIAQEGRMSVDEQLDRLLEDLPNCPFCGDKATIIRHPGIWDGGTKILNNGRMHGLWYVGCSEDFAESYTGCLRPAASWYVSLEEAVSIWKKRD